MHTAEPSSVKTEIAIDELKRYRSPGIYHIVAELLQVEGSTLCFEIHKLINSVWSKEELPQQGKESIIVPIYKECNKTSCNNSRGISLLPTAYKMLSTILMSMLNSICRQNYWGQVM
jgi:hypothetical protein